MASKKIDTSINNQPPSHSYFDQRGAANDIKNTGESSQMEKALAKRAILGSSKRRSGSRRVTSDGVRILMSRLSRVSFADEKDEGKYICLGD